MGTSEKEMRNLEEEVKESLQIAVDAARQRGEPLDHALFFGPPGLGKTTLAMLVAKEMGVNIRTSSGPVLERSGDLVGLLTTLTLTPGVTPRSASLLCRPQPALAVAISTIFPGETMLKGIMSLFK